MIDVKNLNIWKPEEKQKHNNEAYLYTDIGDLNLTVRSFNCLKRAGCNTIQDVLNCIGEDGQGLRRIRNLGSRSETEILEKLEDHKKYCEVYENKNTPKKVTIIKPAKKIWDREIDEFHISNQASIRLKGCAIYKIADLYETNPKSGPGWYAVRELFEKIPTGR